MLPWTHIAYNLIIMAPPTDYATVFTTLLCSKEAANKLGHEFIPVVFDIGILAKALELVWANSVELSSVIPSEGGMHFIMSVFAGIGHLYRGAGLKQLLSESGVYAAGTVKPMMAGKYFKWALHGLKLLDQALNRRLLVKFKQWCIDHNIEIAQDIKPLLERFQMGLSEENITGQVDDMGPLMDQFQSHLDRFREEGRDTSPIFRIWDDFLHRVILPLKMFLAASRRGVWLVYQFAKASLLPMLFASGQTTYARYMPAQVIAMKKLPQAVLSEFEKDIFIGSCRNVNLMVSGMITY